MDGEPLPSPSYEGRGNHVHEVPVRPSAAFKLAVIAAFRESGMTQTEFARRLGKAETEVRCVLNPSHPTKLAAMETALAVLGKRVSVSIMRFP